MSRVRKPATGKNPGHGEGTVPGRSFPLPGGLSRRQVLGLGLVTAVGLAFPLPALASRSPLKNGRVLSFFNTHTDEELECCYWQGGSYLNDSLGRIDFILRDHRTDSVRAIDPGLLDLLFSLRQRLGTSEPFHVISGYRSPRTNAMLRKLGGGVASRSLHLEGKAIDVRVPGVPLPRLRDAALALRGGGVGYYRESAFVHVDTGRVRRW